MAGIVAYNRVSTKRQGASGLGLEGQQAAVEAYSKATGKTIIARYTEVESGRRADRPELAKALAHVRRSKATLVVAKLDRLSRNAAFCLSLQEAGVPFVCCDNQGANELTIGVLALVAREEAKAVSARTKAALQAAKARGQQLGSARPGHWDGREDARLRGLEKATASAAVTNRRQGAEAYTDLIPVVAELRAKGQSLQAVADELNNQGHTTRRGKLWNPVQVSRVLERAKA